MKKILYNNDFQYKICSHNEAFLDISYGVSENGYKIVDIPHDALIGDASAFYSDHVIWYRKKIGITPEKSRRYILYFDGVYFDATVYVNNAMIGRWVNGYTSFYFDITDYISASIISVQIRDGTLVQASIVMYGFMNLTISTSLSTVSMFALKRQMIPGT